MRKPSSKTPEFEAVVESILKERSPEDQDPVTDKSHADLLLELAFKKKYPVVLDENVSGLKPSLKALGFKVSMAPPGGGGDYVKDLASLGGVVATRNTAHFERDAARLDYDIVALEALRFIDPAPGAGNRTSRHIKQALRESRLNMLSGNFILTLKDGGGWSLAKAAMTRSRKS